MADDHDDRPWKQWRTQARQAFDTIEGHPDEEKAYEEWGDEWGEALLMTSEWYANQLDAARERISDLEDIGLELRGDIEALKESAMGKQLRINELERRLYARGDS